MLSLRPAVASDVVFLTSLRRQTMWEHFERVGRPVDEDEQYQRVLNRCDCAEVVVLDGEDIGLLKVVRDTDPWELIQIQLLPEYQGQGLGTILLTQVISEAKKADRKVELGVLRENPARRLYERLGFRVAGETDISYQMRVDL